VFHTTTLLSRASPGGEQGGWCWLPWLLTNPQIGRAGAYVFQNRTLCVEGFESFTKCETTLLGIFLFAGHYIGIGFEDFTTAKIF
jgi:hypothetical protein